MHKPRYIVFAGINGAGKSTLYHSGLWVDSAADAETPRVNPDEIIVQNGWDPPNRSHQFKAGRLALEEMQRHIEAGESFNQETTLAAMRSIPQIKRARDCGFDVCVNYVGVDSPEIALARIKHRASLGGHDVSEENVRRRFQKSLDNLIKAAPLCNTIKLFDNTCQLKLVAYSSGGVTHSLECEQVEGRWYSEIIAQLAAR